jgi:hypothetical protein
LPWLNSIELGFAVELSDTGSMATMTPVASAVSGVFPFSMQAQQSIVVDPKSPGSIDSPHAAVGREFSHALLQAVVRKPDAELR